MLVGFEPAPKDNDDDCEEDEGAGNIHSRACEVLIDQHGGRLCTARERSVVWVDWPGGEDEDAAKYVHDQRCPAEVERLHRVGKRDLTWLCGDHLAPEDQGCAKKGEMLDDMDGGLL